MTSRFLRLKVHYTNCVIFHSGNYSNLCSEMVSCNPKVCLAKIFSLDIELVQMLPVGIFPA